jgi:S1-C subfamily serine protease
MVREAERKVYRAKGSPMPEPVLYPYPDPQVLGLRMDPAEKATVRRVEPGSIAARAGLRPGDAIETLAGQPLLSIADLQWVLHNTGTRADLAAQVRRGDALLDVTLSLPEGWRHADLSWRVTTWDLRRMALGGLRLDDLTDAERTEAGLPHDTLALRVRHAGEFGEHAVAKNAGVQKGDIIVAYDGQTGRLGESDLIAHALTRRRPGDLVQLTVLRGGSRRSVTFALQ